MSTRLRTNASFTAVVLFVALGVADVADVDVDVVPPSLSSTSPLTRLLGMSFSAKKGTTTSSPMCNTFARKSMIAVCACT
jgi:hypothetical protein